MTDAGKLKVEHLGVCILRNQVDLEISSPRTPPEFLQEKLAIHPRALQPNARIFIAYQRDDPTCAVLQK